LLSKVFAVKSESLFFVALNESGGKNMNASISKMTETDYDKMQKLLNLEDADEDLLRAFHRKESNLYSITDNNKIVGVSQIEEGKKAFLYLFIDPAFRRKGIGSTCCQVMRTKNNNAYNLYDSLAFKELNTSHYAIKSIYHSTH
jgi:ribosomal protein S18 acetylase RimI-like enzyme